jgi:hypothetical protein
MCARLSRGSAVPLVMLSSQNGSPPFCKTDFARVPKRLDRAPVIMSSGIGRVFSTN